MAEQYKEAGVNLEAGYESVRRIQSHVARTKVKGAIDSLGAFGGMFDLSVYNLKEPVLVSGTDGVGTKLMLAFEMDKHDTIGIDAVAMCVNDVLVQGAKPIYFLDYIAVGQNKPEVIEQIVKGVADGCVQSACALIGGETAEMPDMYDVDHYDLAGFCVGVVDKSKLKDSRNLKVGDVLIGLPSTGVHSNGFSLVRKVLFKDNHLDAHATYEELDGQLLGDVLLTPTKIYVKAVSSLFDQVDIHAMSHITGGGFYENVPRMLKEGMGVRIDTKAFPRPKIFDFIQQKGKIENQEMYNVFNMGIGFVMAVDPKDVQKVQDALQAIGETSYVIGEVTDSGEVDVQW
ncbi:MULTISPECIES: phosphoribosylformylglycinamidine cyclo-ligase [Faecalicoccus]|uniref:Phosphoribosylformylglycinamidine cyclo-ligase n=1 Tax=Faecalicoccus pleomorphus TaxID=1323 RepID=A0AAW6CQL5_9FIRM|nr:MULTISPECIES: phosphoribosylformylglycinamidine cyclo-ligase [Faecalicoccus]MDB7980627.1 phosphoribosylformylglycinamidine cyclo-ligase [Faecalicoccus pleomorphus]MDB7982834.1 phosphoribosylformylglycinamidine cyclo-ligase [Faecalicoccus pleomorphus]MDB7984212.1 phosphoribosylformylglycinamidine cyclo-ligase [Faecalicoccus pleomorphus]MDB7988098.1 phosphoribosylformylglycinamidine cyclo-ligase [Faecalicoccus pleomorphus]MDB7992447.1 phosphoribosylformylglycinamidine cyclo-ligase [Faecalicoc